MPGTCISFEVLGQDSSLMKAHKMSATPVAANQSEAKADSGSESDSDSNYACEAPASVEELSRACSRPSGKINRGTGLCSGKTDANRSRFDNAIDVCSVSLDSVGRPCKKMKIESLNSVNAATGSLTSSKPCSATTLPNSSHVPQVSKNNSDSGPLDACSDARSDDGEEAANLEDNENVTPSSSQDLIRPPEVAAVMPVRRTQNVWVIGDSWIYWLWKHAQTIHVEKHLNLPDKNIFWFPDKEARFWRTVVPTLRSSVGIPLPDILILHCGADDLGYESVFSLTSAMKSDILKIMSMFPKLKIIFSCIVQRQNWLRQFDLYTNPDKARRDFNRCISEFLRENGMFSIHHNNIIYAVDQLFLPDGVHLSPVGNTVFMNNICDSLKKLS